jgi:hypothetical protein
LNDHYIWAFFLDKTSRLYEQAGAVLVQPQYGSDPDTIAFFGVCFRIDG